MINLRATKTGKQKTQVLNYNYTNKPKIRIIIIITKINECSYTARIT